MLLPIHKRYYLFITGILQNIVCIFATIMIFPFLWSDKFCNYLLSINPDIKGETNEQQRTGL